MRKLFFIVSTFTCIALQAQTQLFVVAGINSTKLSVNAEVPNNKITGGGNTWQTGICAQVPISKKAFMYTGILYETKKVDRTDIACCVFYTEETYHPHYITVPMGVGIQLPVTRSLRVKFSGGAYVSWSAGGNVEGYYIAGNDFPVPGNRTQPTPVYFKRKINFGGSNDNDMTEWDLGLQLGSSIGWKKFEFQFNYRHGFQNLAPDKAYTDNVNYTYNRSLNFNVAYNVFSFHK